MKCEDVQKEMIAFLTDDLDDPKKTEIKDHLSHCPNCTRDLDQQKKLFGVLRTWEGIELSPHLYEKLESRIEDSESFWGKVFAYSSLKKVAFRFVQVSAIVVLTLFISHLLRKPAPVTGGNRDTINLYLTEHQGAVLRTISEELGPQIETRVSVPPEDFLYYEHIDSYPRYTRPGIIFRGPSKSQREILMPETPCISKGEILDLPQARETVDFEPVAPARLHPGYILGSIRKVEGYNSLHLIYTNGIHTLSLFEQPLNGKLGLVAQDFREYAVYRNIEIDKDQVAAPDRATILAWRSGAISFVLIGEEDMSWLMDIAQAVSTVNIKSHGMFE